MSGTHIVFEISRGRIESGDVKTLAACFNAEKMDRTVRRDLFGAITWSFSGYDNEAVELYGIPQVRSFLAEWRRHCPHWLFFGSLETDVLKVMYVCLLAEATATCHSPSGQCRVEFDRCEMVDSSPKIWKSLTPSASESASALPVGFGECRRLWSISELGTNSVRTPGAFSTDAAGTLAGSPDSRHEQTDREIGRERAVFHHFHKTLS